MWKYLSPPLTISFSAVLIPDQDVRVYEYDDVNDTVIAFGA
jgi:hypothetical protein